MNQNPLLSFIIGSAASAKDSIADSSTPLYILKNPFSPQSAPQVF